MQMADNSADLPSSYASWMTSTLISSNSAASAPWAGHRQPPYGANSEIEHWSDIKQAGQGSSANTKAANMLIPPGSPPANRPKRKNLEENDVAKEGKTHGTGRTKRYRQDRPPGSLQLQSPSPPRLDDEMEWEDDGNSNRSSIDVQEPQDETLSSKVENLALLRDAKPPIIATHHSSFLSPTDSRDLPPSQCIPLHLEVSPEVYRLVAALPGYHEDQITVSCKKGGVLLIVADRWEMERQCRHEWTVTFDEDVMMERIAASRKQGGLLQIEAPRFRTSIPIEFMVPRRTSISSR